MRLLATCPLEQLGLVQAFALYSKGQNIKLHLEIHENEVELWAIEEDSLDEAKKEFEAFLQNPKDSKYKVKKTKTLGPKTLDSQSSNDHANHRQQYLDPHAVPPVATHVVAPRITKFLILLCTILYIIGFFEGINTKQSNRAMRSMVLTRTQQSLIFDYPLTLSLIQKFAIEFGDQIKLEESQLSPEALNLLITIQKTPYFQGLYKALVNYKDFGLYWNAQKFGDISKGQIWRLITPTFLHASLLHILFNMLWLYLLGKVVESNLTAIGYIGLTLFLAVCTNVLQYVMTGPLFMGYSGVIAGLGGYVWARQKKAPHEFYPIERRVLGFLGVFIFGLLALQIIAFILQLFDVLDFNMQIANTAHVSGAILGFIVGKIKPGGIKKHDS